ATRLDHFGYECQNTQFAYKHTPGCNNPIFAQSHERKSYYIVRLPALSINIKQITIRDCLPF
ncbi:MAG: hypothetical protein ACK2U1_18790, partial [Anaerolineales bacterium]